MRNQALPLDTTIEAARVQAAAWKRMGMENRLRMAAEMIDMSRATTEAHIRLRHPHYTDRQVRLAGVRLRLGEDLFHQVYPGESGAP